MRNPAFEAGQGDHRDPRPQPFDDALLAQLGPTQPDKDWSLPADPEYPVGADLYGGSRPSELDGLL